MFLMVWCLLLGQAQGVVSTVKFFEGRPPTSRGQDWGTYQQGQQELEGWNQVHMYHLGGGLYDAEGQTL